MRAPDPEREKNELETTRPKKADAQMGGTDRIAADRSGVGGFTTVVVWLQ